MSIYYKSGYKYQLDRDYTIELPIKPPQDLMLDYIHLYSTGHLMIRKGYAWDGPSGPTIDTKNFMRGSLVHDVLYQLMRKELIPQAYRITADELLRDMCKEDGMSAIRAAWVYRGVRIGGVFSAAPEAVKGVEIAP